MDVQRLVVEEPEQTLALDFHAGLTVAFHDRPAVRSRLLDDLTSALGAGRPGLHLEVVDHERHNLAVFRPRGGRPRVIDIDTAEDVTGRYRAADGGVDVLGRLGLELEAVARLIRIGARQLDRLPDTGTDNHRDARRLAGLDQAALWPAAERLDRADVALARAQLALPGRTVADVQRFDAIAAEHATWAATVARHRPIQRLGWLMTGLCLVLGVVLLGLDARIGDNAFTGEVLVGLGMLAGLVTVYDRQAVRTARRSLATALGEVGSPSFDHLATEAGPLADAACRQALVAATAEHEAASLQWRGLAADVSPVWALRHRPAIEALAAQRSQLHRVGAGHLVSDDSAVADSARLLVDRVIELQDVGVNRERLPLLLDEPFAGCAPSDVQRLLETLVRLSAHHQLVLVTGDRYVQAWASEMAADGALSFVRLEDAITPTHARRARRRDLVEDGRGERDTGEPGAMAAPGGSVPPAAAAPASGAEQPTTQVPQAPQPTQPQLA